MRAKESVSLLALCLLLSAALFPIRAMGQAVYGSIIGTVTDASGAAIPGATITITNTGTNVSEKTKSNESGNFTQSRLIPGIYRIKIEAPSFKSAVIEAVTVSIDTASPANVTLQPGQVSEEVTITAEAPLLKTDRADVSTIFDAKTVINLPIPDRNFTRLLQLTPGTQQQLWQHAASENPQGSVQTIVNGQTFSGTGWNLDGTDNRDPILGIIVINPNFESIGETTFTTQNYDAEFGVAVSGVATVSTKSGTNDLHGVAFLYRQNDVLQARNPFSQFQKDPLTGRFIPESLRNQFGGALGGRIIKNKLFFFGDYQGTRSKIGGTRLLTVPTAAARTGDLSAYGVDIYDPATGNATTGAGRTQFSFNGRANVIPTNRISTQARNMLNLLPLPNAPGDRNGTLRNYVASGSEPFDGDTFNVRLDGKLSEKFNTFGRYSFADFTRNGPTAFGNGGGPELVSLGGISDARNQSLAYGFDYVWGPTLVTDFRFGFFRYRVNVLPFDFGAKTAQDAGVPGINFDNTFTSGLFAGFINGNSGVPDINFGSGLGVNRCNCPLAQDEKQFQFVSNTTKFLGDHSFKFGADVRRAFNLRVPSDSHRSGEITFGNGRTGQVTGNSASGGLGLATFMLGDATGFSRYVSTSTDARERQWRHFYYAQDTWRATQKLTISYGLRGEIINPQSLNAPGNGGFVDLATGQVRIAGVGSTKLNGNVENSVSFAPRLGLSYQLSSKTVIRAGYGRGYDIGVFGSVFGHTVTQNLPVLARQNLNAPNNFSAVFNLTQGPPVFNNYYGLDNTPKNNGKALTSAPSSGTFFLPDGVTPRVVNDKQRLSSVDAWNVTVQHQLTNTLSLEVAYVGNKGTHVLTGDNPDAEGNQPTLQGFTSNVPRNQRRQFFNTFGWTQDVLVYCNCADNRYNALQAKLEKRFSNGYSVLTHYTYQRTQNDGRDYFFIDRSVNRGPADFSRDPHNFTFVQTLELPFGKGKQFVGDASRALDLLIGGWQFNSTTLVQSGFPFNVEYDGGADRDTGPNHPNLNGEVTINGGRDRYLEGGITGGVFSRPARGTFGNLKRNALRGPGYWRTDAGMFKRFSITEKVKGEFRVESVNFFNHVNLGNPDSFLGRFAGTNGAADTGSANSNFGRITSTAFFGSDPQRNFQFGLRLTF
jgi:hypothetical protein